MNELDFSEIQRLSEKYGKDPKSRIFVQLADLYRKNNMLDEALDVINKGLEYHPEYPVAYLILGKCYYDKRSHIQARDAFEKTIALDPQNIVALQMMAKTCEILKDERGQINAYKSIISIDPLDNNAKEKLAMLEALQRKEPLYTIAMAEEYEKQGTLDEALKIYEHLLYTDPSDLVLNQKVAELKKLISAQKMKLETEKIEDMKVEPVFKNGDLAHKEPEKIDVERFGDSAPVPQESSGESEIQSLEDFLVEELEQAAEKKATEPQTASAAPSETTAAEDIPAASQVIPEPSPEQVREPVAEEIPAEQIEQGEGTMAEAEPTSFADFIGEEPGTKETVSPEVDVEPATMDKKTPPMQEAPETIEAEPVSIEETPVRETPEPIPEPTSTEAQPAATTPHGEGMEPPEPVSTETAKEPVVQESAELAEPGTTEPKEEIKKKEEPKKPKEEDFKSFQDWLSGLLK